MTPLVAIITSLKQQHAASWSPVSDVWVCGFVHVSGSARVSPHSASPATESGIAHVYLMFLINFKVERVKFNMGN